MNYIKVERDEIINIYIINQNKGWLGNNLDYG